MDGELPQPFEGKFDAGLQGGGTSGENKGIPLSFLTEITWTKEQLSHVGNPPERLWSLLGDTSEYIERYGDPASRDTAWKVRWSFLSLASSRMDAIAEAKGEGLEARESAAPEMYSRFKEEQASRGETADEIVLNRQQAQTLKQLLALVDIPFEVTGDEEHISVAPLAQEAAGVTFARRAHKTQQIKEIRQELAAGYETGAGTVLRVIKQEKREADTDQTPEPPPPVIDLEAERQKRRAQS